METWTVKGNGSPTYLLCFLMEQLLDISLTPGTIQSEHRVPRLASTCPRLSCNSTTGEADPSRRSAILLGQTPAVLDSPLYKIHYFIALTVKAGKTEDTAVVFLVCRSTRLLHRWSQQRLVADADPQSDTRASREQ